MSRSPRISLSWQGTRMKRRIALYGNQRLERADCPSCGSRAFVLDREYTCCHHPILRAQKPPRRFERITEPVYIRRRPSARLQSLILETQDFRCLYCLRRFGAPYKKGDRTYLARLSWDHLTPFSYQQDNSFENFAAACTRCNGWKSDLVFRDI